MTQGPDPRPWLPLTAAQRGLYFAHELDPANPCYTTAEVVEVAGELDPDLLEEALRGAYAEFEQLRTRYRTTPEGPQQQVVDRTGRVNLVVDLRAEADPEAAAAAWMRADLARPMDLAGGDVVRSAVLRLGPARSWWYHAAHHVVLDGFGVVQLLRRVAERYTALADGVPLAALEEVPLAALVAGDPEDDAGAAAFWDQRLGDMDGVVALAGRTAAPAPAALKASLVLDAEQQTALARGARRLGTTWADLVLAGVGGYLARLTGAARTRIGLPLMNRARPGHGSLPSARTVCTAMNVLPATVPADGTVAEALAAVATEQEEVRLHPFVRQEELTRRLARGPGAAGAQLFGAQVNLIPFDLELRLGGAAGTVRNLTAGPVEDMTVCLRGNPGRGRVVRLEIDANPHLYDAEDMRLHLARLAHWLTRFAAAAPDDRVADLALLTEAERAQVVHGFNDTDVPLEHRTLARRFRDQAARTPDDPALLCAGRTTSYAELAERADRLARALHARGVRAGDVVGVLLPRGEELFTALYAVQRLGAVHLPLGTDQPPARLAGMLADAGCRLVLSDAAHRGALDRPVREGGPEAPVVVDVGEAGPVAEVLPAVPDDPDAPAYLLFTSGSTGRPKGVLVGQRAIDNRLRWMQHRLPLALGERVLHKTPVTFDVSVWELFWPLQVGACVVVAEPDAHRDPRRIADLLVEHDVRVVHFVPSMLRAFLADRASRERAHDAAVRHVVCSGEALTAELVDGCHEVLGVAPVNLYGPTEAAVDVTCFQTVPGTPGPVPIGRPIWNTATYVLGADGEPRPVGVPGELFLGGVQLAEGYVGRPDLTTERFLGDPFRPGGRMYRTGDLARWRPDGTLEYLGRTDDQVKVRGQRVELGEVEAALDGVDGVTAVAAGTAGGGDGGVTSLVLWFVPADGVPADLAEQRLRAAAQDRLPEAIRPGLHLAVPAMPLGSSGKTDRRRLAELAPPVPGRSADAPRDLAEQRLCALFAEVLGLVTDDPAADDLATVGPDDDFFALGGDSLRVLRLLGAVEDAFATTLELRTVFAAPTPAGLAAALARDAAVPGGFEEVLSLRADRGTRPPLFLLPPAGGLGWCYTGLLRALPVDQGVHVVQAPGLESGRPEPVADLEALARRQLAAIRRVVGDGPFHLAGWSLGGMAAHEVAALARDEGQQVASVLLLDAYPADQWRQLGEPTEEEALVGVLRLGGVEGLRPAGVPVDRALVAELLRRGGSALAELPAPVLDGCLASVVEAARLVRTSRHRVLPGDLTLVVATAPRPEQHLDPAGWAAYVEGRVQVVPVDSTHGDLVRAPAVDEVGRVLAGLLEAEPVGV
ncbi:amino acid adenylation domain-containing protein [Nocardioides sp. dk4132]|uniref:non-ribosomal peptide synthetase n=1 Tax=unclassified Nocardioides TaxID=2615069 RepID=UPI0012968B79|nr:MULTISPECIES: non-ribosomal peptide synthetase [unclassified Nocardioides]MQW75278.1 amino acid adenylation domain-containing protein [Nocardioides sp. dk4132]QGA07571.1 amino acid adenylation domain-containing protein [Nocardioides sp. dk884]